MQLAHWQSLTVSHKAQDREVHPSESVAAAAPIRATATVKNSTFRYMTAADLLLLLIQQGKPICRETSRMRLRRFHSFLPVLRLLVAAAVAAR